MDSTTVSSVEWLQVVGGALTEADSSPKAVIKAVRTALGARFSAVPLAMVLAESLAELMAYAGAPSDTGHDAVDLEVEAVAAARRIVRPLLQGKLQQRLDAIDERHAGQSACANPTCEGCAESQGRIERNWSSTLGSLSLRRRYRYCARCEQGFAPAQKVLGLPSGQYTARLEEACAMMSTTVSHGMAQQLVEKLLGLEVSIKALEDITERRGVAVHALQCDEATTCAPYDDTGLPVPSQQRPDDAVPPEAAPRVAYAEIDGVSALTRQERTGDELTPADKRRQTRARKEQARGGKARRYDTVGREVKNGVLYDGAQCARESPSRGCILDKTYVSRLGEWQAFAPLLWTEMLRLRIDEAKLLVILSDGAEWIRSLAAWLPIETFLILDLYHVKRRIFEVAHSLYGDHTPRARKWADEHCALVEQGHARRVVAALGFLRPRRAETRELVTSLAGFLTNNLDRMDYPTYRARGLRVSTSTVESGNFHVTGQRLKVQGTRWSDEGAAQMASLRADLFNGRWERRTKALLAAA